MYEWPEETQRQTDRQTDPNDYHHTPIQGRGYNNGRCLTWLATS